MQDLRRLGQAHGAPPISTYGQWQRWTINPQHNCKLWRRFISLDATPDTEDCIWLHSRQGQQSTQALPESLLIHAKPAW